MPPLDDSPSAASLSDAPIGMDRAGRNAPNPRRDLFLLALFGALFALLYCLFYPPITTTMDEGTMLNMAYVYRTGTWFADVAGVDIVFSYHVGGHIIPQYPPAMSIVLAAFSFLGWKSVFLSGLAFHLATYAIVAAILRKIGVSPLLALVYLLYPTCVIYSRTVMTDLPSGTLIAAAFLCLLYRRYPLAGFLAGLSVIFRTPNLAAVGLLALGAFADRWITERRFGASVIAGALVVAGALPCLAANYAYQRIVQNGEIMSSYTSTNIAPAHILATLPRYLFYLSVMLPGMLITPLLYRRAGRFTVLLLTYGYVLVYSLSYYTDFTGSKLETLVVSQRYLQAVIPLFVVAYVTAWDNLTKTGRVGAWLQRTTPFLLAAMGIVAIGIQAKHQSYLQDLAEVRGQVLDLTAPEDRLFCNAHVAKLLHPGWDPRRYKIISWTDGTTAALTEDAERDIDAALDERDSKHTQQRIVVAMHSREYRPETKNDLAVLDGITRRYVVQAFTPQTRPGFPNGLVVLYITSRQPAAPALPAAPTTAAPIQHTAAPE